MLGFELRDTSAGHELTPGYATAYASSSDQSDLLENYSTEMTTAKSVLDYLTAIYNAVSNFIDAQNIARNYTIFGDTADVVSSTRTLKTGADNTNYNKLLLALPMPDNGSGITENLVSLLTTDAVNPKYFMSELYDFSTGSEGSDQRRFYDNSSTCLILNMINLVCSGIKGMKNVINYSDNYSYETGNLIGYKVSSLI